MRKRQEERAAREQEAKAHEEAQQAAEEQQFQRINILRKLTRNVPLDLLDSVLILHLFTYLIFQIGVMHRCTPRFL